MNTIDNETTKVEKKRRKMLETPVELLICQMSVPTVISMLVTAFYNMADTYFVGLLKSNTAIGAVGIVFALMTVIQAFGFFFGHGSGNNISRMIGTGEYEKASDMAAVGFFSSFFMGMFIMVLGLFFQVPLARLLGAPDIMLEETLQYMRYILIAAPFMMAATTLNNQLRHQGNAVFSMFGLVSGAVVNVILDPVFIFVFELGAAGAALATMLSQMLSFFILFIGCQVSSNVSIKWKNFHLKLAYYKRICNGGLPSLGRQGLTSVSTLLLNHIAAGFGAYAIAAFAIITKIVNICYVAIIGLGQGFQPVCGFNYGAKRFDRVKRALSFAVEVSTGLLIIIAIIVYFKADDLMRLFSADEEVIVIGVRALRYQAFVLPISGWVIMMNMFLQNIGRVIPATILATAKQGIVFIPVLFLLSGTLGLQGLELTQPTADFCTFLLSIPLSIPALRTLTGDNSNDI